MAMNRVYGAVQYLMTGALPGQAQPATVETVHQEIIAQPRVQEIVPEISSDDGVIQLSPNDVIIAVMGVTGAGKSTFINHLADHPVVIGHGLESCTTDVSIHRATVDNRNVFLVDTPGFDDTYKTDTEVLRDLAFWLTESYKEDIKLTGIVYLHPISNNRVGGAAMKNLRMFKRLCGETGLGSVVLATTMWSNEDPTEATRRERELQSKPDFWGDMIKHHSKVFRQDQGATSALTIIKYLINRRQTTGPVALDIQRDMVDRGMSLDQTAAGQEVQAEIEKQRAKHEKELRHLRREMEEAIRNADRVHQQDLAATKADMEKKIAKGEQDLKALRVGRRELERQVRDQAQKHQRDLEEMDKRIKVKPPAGPVLAAPPPQIIRETKTKYVPEIVLCNVM